jgi:Protein of unknown function (DUF3014)
MRAKVIIAAIVVALAGLGAYLYYERARTPAAPPPPAPAAPSAESPPPVQYPVPETATAPAEESPPPIDDSDPALHDALVEVFGQAAGDALVPDSIMRRIVATIDGLPRAKLAARVRPVNPPAGHFIAAESDGELVLGPDNYARYTPLVQLVENADADQLVALYFRFYRRFQEAYQQLGYPDAYFNDRLVQVIDDLLATPEPAGPVKLVRPNVMYEYADPDLEACSVGQKVLLRMGPENAARIKAKLRAIRAAITNQTPLPETPPPETPPPGD